MDADDHWARYSYTGANFRNPTPIKHERRGRGENSIVILDAGGGFHCRLLTACSRQGEELWMEDGGG